MYTYLHLAADKDLTMALLDNKVSAVAYETIENQHGELPCLRPMSEIAGRLSVQEGAKYLEKPYKGRGVLLEACRVERGKVAIIGGGNCGFKCMQNGARGMGANVTILDIGVKRLVYLDDVFNGSNTTLYSSEANIQKSLSEADLVIGAVLIPERRRRNLLQNRISNS